MGQAEYIQGLYLGGTGFKLQTGYLMSCVWPVTVLVSLSWKIRQVSLNNMQDKCSSCYNHLFLLFLICATPCDSTHLEAEHSKAFVN